MLYRCLPLLLVFALTGCDKSEPTAPAPKPADPPAAPDKPATPDEPATPDAPAATETNGDAPAVGEWVSLFDGKTLGDWKKTDFHAGSTPKVEDGALVIPAGEVMSGVTWSGDLPARVDYEIEYEAKKIDGSDFFAALTFPVGDRPCTLVNGGWGGGVTGLSSIDGYDASENSTSSWIEYKKDQWYRFRLRVTGENISAWVDGKRYVNANIGDSDLSIRIEVEPNKPLGFATYQTTGALRNIRMKRIDPNADYDKGEKPDDPINDLPAPSGD